MAVVAWRSASRRRRKARKRAMFWSMDQHQFAMISTPDTLTRWRQKMMAEDEGQVKMLGGEMMVCSISVSNGRWSTPDATHICVDKNNLSINITNGSNLVYGISVSDSPSKGSDATHSDIDNNDYQVAVDGRREEESEVHAKPVLRLGQGTATGNHHSRQEAPTNYDDKLQLPMSNTSQLDACENTQWFVKSSHSHWDVAKYTPSMDISSHRTTLCIFIATYSTEQRVERVDVVTSLGLDHVQGYWLHRVLPAPEQWTVEL
jgi:hypothetical protein